MPQLVGLPCVVCRQPVESILEGRFCGGCGGAVHNECMRPPVAEEGVDHCPNCGAVGRQEVAAHLDVQRKNRAGQRPGRDPAQGPFPVSQVCPACGHTEYRQTRPQRLIAFSWDRICSACQTRYTPPTPIWAAILFILVGLPMVGVGTTSVILRVLNGNLAGTSAMACEGFGAVLGVLAIIQGVRALLYPGKV